MNGRLIGTISLKKGVTSAEQCLAVDTRFLKFAHLAPSGQTPTPDNGLAGNNDITITAHGTMTGLGVGGGDIGIGDVIIRSLSFDAMAPVVLVHGIRDEDGKGWYPYQSSRGRIGIHVLVVHDWQ